MGDKIGKEAGVEVCEALPKMPDALKHNRSGITHVIECIAPLDPVDRSGARGEVRILAAVVVVDVCGGQASSRGVGFHGGAGREVRVAGIKRQCELLSIEVA